jgi:hypothetical protein
MGFRRMICRGAALALLSAGVALAQPVKLAPVDEAAGDATWTRFRARLIDALTKRDHKFVDSIVDRKIRNISGNDGIVQFRKLWELQKADSPLWNELPKALFLGSARAKHEGAEEICAPYVYFKWPANAPDDANAAVIAKEAIVQSRPSSASPALATLAYDLVEVKDWEVSDEDKTSRQIWVAVKTASGNGYLPQEQVRSPLEYRACFVKRDGNWRMSGLEVGE